MRHFSSALVVKPIEIVLAAAASLVVAVTAGTLLSTVAHAQVALQAHEPVVPSGMSPANVSRLHSRPGATYTAYLDFTGPVITNSIWQNQVAAGRTEIESLNFQLDGNRAYLTADEISYIAAVWRTVAEDFAPFDVDVTTERPDSIDENTLYAVITENKDRYGHNMPSPSNDGASAFGYFGNAARLNSQPVWIYHKARHPVQVGANISHYLGHTLGLRHDYNDATGKYFLGLGEQAGRRFWCSLMSIAPGTCVRSQWSNGALHSDATNGQDDIAVIGSQLGFASDDHANWIGQSTPLEISSGGLINHTTPQTDPFNTQSSNKGIIESESDIDMFGFTTPGGYVRFTVSMLDEGVRTGSNLEAPFLAIFDSNGYIAGSSIAGANPHVNVLFKNLPAGDYNLAVVNAATLKPIVADRYGSRGQYFIGGYIQGISGPANDLVGPVPNPLKWRLDPLVSAEGELTMKAVSAIDHTGLFYQFQCVAGPGCISSGWQRSSTYVASGLTPNARYTWRARAKDGAGNLSGFTETISTTTALCPVVVASPSTDLESIGNNRMVLANGAGNPELSYRRTNECLTPDYICPSVRFVEKLGVPTSPGDVVAAAICSDGIWQKADDSSNDPLVTLSSSERICKARAQGREYIKTIDEQSTIAFGSWASEAIAESGDFLNSFMSGDTSKGSCIHESSITESGGSVDMDLFATAIMYPAINIPFDFTVYEGFGSGSSEYTVSFDVARSARITLEGFLSVGVLPGGFPLGNSTLSLVKITNGNEEDVFRTFAESLDSVQEFGDRTVTFDGTTIPVTAGTYRLEITSSGSANGVRSDFGPAATGEAEVSLQWTIEED